MTRMPMSIAFIRARASALLTYGVALADCQAA